MRVSGYAVVGLVAGALVVAFVLGMGYFLGGLGSVFSLPESPERDAVYRRAEVFLGGLVERNYEKSWAVMDRSGPNPPRFEGFRAAVTGNRWLAGLRGAGLGSYTNYGDAATLSGSFASEAGEVAGEIHLVRQDDDWFVTQVVVAGRPVLPGDG